MLSAKLAMKDYRYSGNFGNLNLLQMSIKAGRHCEEARRSNLKVSAVCHY
jgi:hypothetical protein